MIIRLFIVLFVVLLQTNIQAQKNVSVACGDKITGEFTTPVEKHVYEITLQPGQIIEAKVIPTGDYLNFRVELFDPVGSEIIRDATGTFRDPNKRNINLKSGILSGRGVYKIIVYNFSGSNNGGRVGVYSVQFTCTTP